MNESDFELMVWGWLILALLLIPVQLFITAPYGRHSKRSWGPVIDNRMGWVIMEIVSPLAFAFFFLKGNPEFSPVYLFFGIWMIHYINRSLIFPLRTKTTGKVMPIVIMFSAVFFNAVNGSINGYYFGNLADHSFDLFSRVHFWLGALLFLTGFIINLNADQTLLNLRKGEERGYKIPQGGLFKWISCPNHFGEIIEWLGFALMAWCLPAFSFAVWTAANLIPRSISHHRWYKQPWSHSPRSHQTGPSGS